MSLSEEAIDARCAAWAHHGKFLDATGTETWPDGTVARCYRFRHTLYQEVVYARVSAGQRLRLHYQIGAGKEAGDGDQALTIAVEFAVHFERAQEADRAVRYLRHAVDHAMQRSAYADVLLSIVRKDSIPLRRYRPHRSVRSRPSIVRRTCASIAVRRPPPDSTPRR